MSLLEILQLSLRWVATGVRFSAHHHDSVRNRRRVIGTRCVGGHDRKSPCVTSLHVASYSRVIRFPPPWVPPVMRSARTMMSWILLVAMLVSLPGGTMGHFVCTLGMHQAGPSCPLCHGHASAKQPGPGVENNCCKFVAGRSAMDPNLAPEQIEKPALTQASLLPPHAGFGLLVASDRDPIAGANGGAVPRTPTSGYLSNFLRL